MSQIEYAIPRPYMPAVPTVAPQPHPPHAALLEENQRLTNELYLLRRTLENMTGDHYTHAGYATEKQSMAELTGILRSNGLFVVREQVEGQYLFMRPEQEGHHTRIDVVLEPTAELLAHGWSYGFVGIEGKNSREKVGRPISQCIDYKHCVFNLDSGPDKDSQGARYVYLGYVFIWPWTSQGGPLGSITAQQRLGGAYLLNDKAVCLQTGTEALASFRADGRFHLYENRAAKVGKGAGSR